MKITTVVEGSFMDDWHKMFLMPTDIQVPKDIGLIEVLNGKYRFKLVYLYNPETKQYEEQSGEGENIDLGCDLIWHRGMLIEVPRAVIVDDGRVYISEDMMKKKEYVEKLISEVVPNIFRHKLFGKEVPMRDET
ncbi:MAG: hypothetical protein DRO11_00770 [Methanobacteriota archaeon]|nr:MAG: hypothetical protein DRO11_00770 [Euryarchaeota archaeon]